MKTEAARPIKAEKHLWYQYNGRKNLNLKNKEGIQVTLKKGDIYGVQNINNRIDRVVIPSRPDVRFLLPVETVGDILDASKRHREPVAFAVIEKPIKPKKITFAKKPETISRLEAIKKAAKTVSTKAVKKVKPKKIAVRPRTDFDLDEDTFADYGDDFSDIM